MGVPLTRPGAALAILVLSASGGAAAQQPVFADPPRLQPKGEVAESLDEAEALAKRRRARPAAELEYELDIRYTWVRWNLESLVAHAFPAKGLTIGQVHIV